MDTRIYVMTHKAIEQIDNKIYIPLQVGKAGKESLGYIGDDTGFSISEKNSHYCELTGIYWLWKNICCDIIGVCHYRRFFVKNEQILQQEYIEQTLQQYDMIIPYSGTTQEESVEVAYAVYHHIDDLLQCGKIIQEKHPEYMTSFQVALRTNLFSIGNMWITKKYIFDQYCEWLFDILFEVEKRIDFTDYDDYQSRVMGFLSERLFRVWLLNQQYLVREEQIKMIDTKDFLNDVKSMQLKYQCVKTSLKPLIQLYQAYKHQMDTFPCLAEHFEQQDDFEGKIPVWVCWWQGEENAPELVKVCINSIRNSIPNEKAVLRLITFENYKQYVTLTETVIRKFEEGKITLTHLSDMLRAELLYRYGGLWLDATYYFCREIPEPFFCSSTFWTLKYEHSISRSDISKGRWSCNALRVPAKSLFARFLMEGLWVYWEMNDSLVDYFWMDDVIALEYELFPQVREEIDQCPVSDSAVLELQQKLNQKFDTCKYQKLTEKTRLFKLNRRIELQEKMITQEQTFWGYIKQQSGCLFI